MNKKGQAGILVLVISVVIGIIALVGVGVPIMSGVVTAANLTGTSATIANNLVPIALLGALVLVAGLAVFGMSRR